MPVIRDGEKAREIIENIKKSGNSLPCFCTENVLTTEAIFIGARKFKKSKKIKEQLPLIIAFTAAYHQRQQLKNYSGLGDLKEGMLAVRNDIERIARAGGKFDDIDIIVHLDHAQPGDDEWILKENKDFISSVMYDCSSYALKENTEMVKIFVKKNKEDFIIEGCFEEIAGYGEESSGKSGAEEIAAQADKVEVYFKETGADLVVVDLGTEHRRTEHALKKYRRDIARRVRDKIGRQMVLHGASSLSGTELKNLPLDGVVKVNIWTALEAGAGRALAVKIIENIDKILLKENIEKLAEENFLDKKVLNKKIRPSLAFLTEKYRRDEIFIPAVAGQVKNYYENLYIHKLLT